MSNDPIEDAMEIWWDEAIDDVRAEALEKSKFYKERHLDNLIRRAEFSPRGPYRMQTYIIASPVPLVLTSTPKQNEAYTMVNTVKRHRFSKEIAEELIAEKKEFAHMYALEKLDNRNNEALWRDVLAWLDELKGETK